MKLTDYRKKLGISLSDEERVKQFKIRVLNSLPILELYISDAVYLKFCNNIGIPTRAGNYNRYPDIAEYLHSSKLDFNKFLFGYIVLIHCIEYEQDRKDLKRILANSLDMSEIPFEVIEEDGYFVFPKGAEELDNALVSQPLIWLEAYPKSREVFIQALKKYSNPKSNNSRTIADEFRKALESFFQEFFNSDRNLENLKSEYGNYMKKMGIPPEISNTLEKLQKLYTDYMNDYVKHQNNTQQNVLEYIMYQTGNIIRLLITLKNSENEQ